MADDDLAIDTLRTWAECRDPEYPDWGRHKFDARCPWCRDTVHDTAKVLLDEIERLRAEVNQLGAELVDTSHALGRLRVENECLRSEQADIIDKAYRAGYDAGRADYYRTRENPC